MLCAHFSYNPTVRLARDGTADVMYTFHITSYSLTGHREGTADVIVCEHFTEHPIARDGMPELLMCIVHCAHLM